MNKIILVLVCIAFLISGVIAVDFGYESEFGRFRQNGNITLVQLCGDCTYVNISSVKYPNSSTMVSNIKMTQTGSEFSYSLGGAYHRDLGVYTVNGLGDLNGTPTVWKYTYEITPNGEEATVGKAVFYIGLLFIILLFLLIAIFVFQSTEQIWVRAFSSGGIYLLLMSISFIAWQMAADFLTSSPFLIELFRIAFIVLTIGFFPFLILMFAYGVYMMATLKEINDMRERGIGFDEAMERRRRR